MMSDKIGLNQDLDSVLLTALRLLHSKSKSSTDQLKLMLDEALAQKHASLSNKIIIKTDKNKSTFDKKPIEKIKLEPQDSFESKKIRTIPPLPTPVSSLISSTPSIVPTAALSRSLSSSPSTNTSEASQTKAAILKLKIDLEQLNKQTAIKSEDDSEATDIEEETNDSGDFSVEMGMVCLICKHSEISPSNQLIECQECHNLYHQECHRPPLSDREISDPRLVWYCSKCVKSLKKLTNKSAKTNQKSPNTTTSALFQTTISNAKETAIKLLQLKSESIASTPSISVQPFKRAEPKSSSNPGSNINSPKPVIGLAGLAANISRTNSTSSNSMSTSGASIQSSSNTSSSNSPAIAASNPLIVKSADKRLQQMKKKAAKGQEKKRFTPK